MIKAGIAVLMMLFNLILYFMFGSLITGRMKKNVFSVTLTVFTGFFLYYTLFTICCIPVMLKWRPLTMLCTIWGIVCAAVAVLSAVLSFRSWKKKLSELAVFISRHWCFTLAAVLITAAEAVIIICNYQFTLDAAYYVANVTTSLQTNTMNIYDPYTGDWQDHFEMRYFFATYPMNDAVMCEIFGIAPLIWTKTTMTGVAVILTNMMYYMIGNRLFRGDRTKVLLMLFFASVMNFFFITIFTPSEFLIARTYEGKCLLGNVVLPGIIYIYMLMLEDTKRLSNWLLLLLVCLGAPVLSSSSNMLLPAMIAVTLFPLAVIRKDRTVILKSIICMLPCIALLLMYVAYVRGMFVFYTYPK